MARAISLLSQASSPIHRKLPPATSSHKVKRIDERDWVAVAQVLRRGRSDYDALLLGYFGAALVSGLRPAEWANCRLVETRDAHVLIVRNSKNSNGRAHGAYRRLVWAKAEHAEVLRVKTWLAMMRDALADLQVSERHDAWSRLRKALQSRLHSICVKLWPRRQRHPTLYSARHTFAALAKPIYSTTEVAALMGHAVDDTATRRYARPAKGSKKPPDVGALPAPHPRDVRRVRMSTRIHRIPSTDRHISGYWTLLIAARLFAILARSRRAQSDRREEPWGRRRLRSRQRPCLAQPPVWRSFLQDLASLDPASPTLS